MAYSVNPQEAHNLGLTVRDPWRLHRTARNKSNFFRNTETQQICLHLPNSEFSASSALKKFTKWKRNRKEKERKKRKRARDLAESRNFATNSRQILSQHVATPSPHNWAFKYTNTGLNVPVMRLCPPGVARVPPFPSVKRIPDMRHDKSHVHNQNQMSLLDAGSDGAKVTYIVLDTNVLIDDLTIVKSLIHQRQRGRFTLVGPWVVLVELDKLKMPYRKANLKDRAQDAIRFINATMKKNDVTLLILQTCQQNGLVEQEVMNVAGNDDQILKCAIQISKQVKERGRTILVTNDLNLQNKAMAVGVTCKAGKDLAAPPMQCNPAVGMQFQSATNTYPPPAKRMRVEQNEWNLHQ